MKICKNCNLTYDDKFAFCQKCGEKLHEVIEQYFCPYCGNKIETDGDFCPFCGNQLADTNPIPKPIPPAKVDKTKIEIQKKTNESYTTSNNKSIQIGPKTKSFLETGFLLLLMFFMVFFVIPKFFDLMRDYSILFWIFIAVPVVFTLWFIYQSIVSVYYGVKKKDYLSTLVPIIILGWVAFIIAMNVFR